MNREQVCCFSGHRPEKLPWREDEEDHRCTLLKEQIYQEVERAYDEGFRHFICGMARGCDFYFCEAVLALRDERPGVTVEAALPCEEQALHWKEPARERYFELIGLCDCKTVVQRRYGRGCMFRRDRYMVNQASRLVAAFNGATGGTLYTITYAMKKGVEVVTIRIPNWTSTDK